MYYPQQRHVTEMMRIRRRTLLPETAIGSVRVEQGQIVDVRDNVARGLIPQEHHIIEAAAELGLKKAADLNDLVRVPLNRPVTQGTFIAGRDESRGKRIFAPMDCIIAYVGEGRIIIQEMPQLIKLEAGVRGQVVQIHAGRGVSIEATGGVIQGVWGNDRHTIATLRFEPEEGIASISQDEMDTSYRGEIMISLKPLSINTIEIANTRNFAGIIAPSMDASLLAVAMSVEPAIMLTAGFGNAPMSRNVQQILELYNGYQAVLDAALPRRFDERRPEMMIHRSVQGQTIPLTEAKALQVGMIVRITRDPYLGRIGKVTELPHLPVLIRNGLKVMVARVELGLEENVEIPLANIELAGE